MKSVVESAGRARVRRFIFNEEFLMAEAEPMEEPTVSERLDRPLSRFESVAKSVLSAFLRERAKTASMGENQSGAFRVAATTTDSVAVLADRIASVSSLDLASKQTLLEIIEPFERLGELLSYLNAIELRLEDKRS
jgi:ATP-dependent Lon protease